MPGGTHRQRATGSRPTRRDFLRAGGFAGAGLALASAAPAGGPADDRAVILLVLVGGPSQLDTFDPKPDAPAEVRGPFRTIATRVPGVRLCEHLPRLAARLDRVALVRSLHHDAAPIHETGLQLLQTGRLALPDSEGPHVGAIAAARLGRRGPVPPFALLPGPIGSTGVAVSHGQTAGALGADDGPWTPPADRVERLLAGEPPARRDAYGPTDFGRDCRLARRLVERGCRCVVVNMYPTVFNRRSWDCHGSAPFSTLDDYAAEVLPTFDTAYAALLDDLERTGRLGSTLVVAAGEFGRTPKINNRGGRDHWPAAWTALVAGGGVRGGQVVGATDRHAAEPKDRPVSPAALAATMAGHLGVAAALPGADATCPLGLIA